MTGILGELQAVPVIVAFVGHFQTSSMKLVKSLVRITRRETMKARKRMIAAQNSRRFKVIFMGCGGCVGARASERA